MTTKAFESAIGWFPLILTISIGLFAYSTMISWGYYGERGWIYLLDHFGGIGLKTVIVFRVIFVLFVLVGAVYPLRAVLDFSDAMVLGMAFPNIIGSIILAPRVPGKSQELLEPLPIRGNGTCSINDVVHVNGKCKTLCPYSVMRET